MRLLPALLLSCMASAVHAQGPVRIVTPAAPAAQPATTPADPGAAGIIVQGGLQPGCDDTGDAPERRGALAIGPKQDDPRSPAGAAARPGDDNDPKARGGALAIGPKQDDPARPGRSMRNGLQDGNAGGVRGPGVLAIGPKQDDPRSPAGTAARPGDDTDPKARCAPRLR